MTWADVIRSYIPDASDDLCEFILWEQTCYPVGGEDEIREQIREFAESLRPVSKRAGRSIKAKSRLTGWSTTGAPAK